MNLTNLQGRTINKSNQDLELIRSLDLEYVEAKTPDLHHAVKAILTKSKSDLRQDLFVLRETAYKQGGFFVEFGAANGIDGSNTYLLETEFLWRGILVEPAITWQKSLLSNRPAASIESLCVWKDSNSTLVFNETEALGLSTIDIFSSEDAHAENRRNGKKYEVATISLKDLLIKHQAPEFIDYLSIDTEGSEFEILNNFNFNAHDFGIITVEHNYTSQRAKIFSLLASKGYKRVHESISDIDDWYVKIDFS